jgi:hypothetical protein
MREAMDRQIDRLVYELYGLTEEEIEIGKFCRSHERKHTSTLRTLRF